MGNADVPRESGKSMCACMSCKLVKTYAQVFSRVLSDPTVISTVSSLSTVCLVRIVRGPWLRKLRMAAHGGRRHSSDRLHHGQLHGVQQPWSLSVLKRDVLGFRSSIWHAMYTSLTECAMLQADSYCRSFC